MNVGFVRNMTTGGSSQRTRLNHMHLIEGLLPTPPDKFLVSGGDLTHKALHTSVYYIKGHSRFSDSANHEVKRLKRQPNLS